MKPYFTGLVAAAILFTVSLTNNAFAGQFEDGLAAYNRQDFKVVVTLWRAAGDQGDVNAQYHLGTMYLDGRGVKQDYAEAMKWLHMAADRGQAGAQNRIGVMYRDGLGVEPDDVEAYMWFSLAAAGGNKFLAKDRDALAAHISPAQVAEGLQRAKRWRAATNR